MPGIFIDSEDLNKEARDGLSTALTGIAEADVPLVFEVSLVTEDEIKRLNQINRQKDAVTDVLSFPSMNLCPGEKILSGEHEDSLDEEGRLLAGSIAICTQRAKEQAEEYGHSFERELYYLAVHGVLHCLGYDHETEKMKAQMREREELIMQRMHLGRGV